MELPDTRRRIGAFLATLALIVTDSANSATSFVGTGAGDCRAFCCRK